jgi:hypothetical protein
LFSKRRAVVARLTPGARGKRVCEHEHQRGGEAAKRGHGVILLLADGSVVACSLDFPHGFPASPRASARIGRFKWSPKANVLGSPVVAPPDTSGSAKLQASQ